MLGLDSESEQSNDLPGCEGLVRRDEHKSSKSEDQVPELNLPSDDSDDDEPIFPARKKALKEAVTVSEDCDSDKNVSDDDSDIDDDIPIFRKKRIARRPVLDDSDEDASNDNIPTGNTVVQSDSEEQSSQVSKSTKTAQVGSDSEAESKHAQDDSDSDSDIGRPDDMFPDDDGISPLEMIAAAKKRLKQAAVQDDDLFDKEMDSDSEAESNNNRARDDDSDSDVGRPDDMEVDDFSPAEMTAALKKRLKQGASKKPKTKATDSKRPSTAKAHKQQQEELQNLHSESQRIVRDSAVRLPYHKPNKLDLSNILARTQQKQQQFQSLRVSSGPLWKNSPDLVKTQSKLSPPSVSGKADTDVVPVEKNSTPQTASVQVVSDVTVAGKDGTSALLDAVSDSLLSQPKTDNQKAKDFWDDDELPDLNIEEVAASSSTNQNACNMDSSKETNEEEAKNCDPESQVQVVAGEATKEKDSGRNEQDSGYLTAPSNNNSSEENSSDNSSDQPVAAESIRTDHADAVPMPEEPSQLTPKLGNLKVDAVQPRLSAGPGDFIDFEEDAVVTPKTSGVEKLLERLVKHSCSHHKKGKTVQISTIQKETGEGDQDEYKVENIIYDLEAEEEYDPALEKPGAKLFALKDKLKEQMKQKREEARQRRLEVYEMDNEEGYGDGEEEEEEAELTDQTDTDVEEEVEAEEDEEMDDGEYTQDEKKQNEDNPFVDAEADDDDDDDNGEINEDDLHLALDTQDNDGDDEMDEDSEKTSKDFLTTAMKKTAQSLDLFDDDANTESPTISQHSNQENIEVSERPFEQLSGETCKSANNSPDNSCLATMGETSANNSSDLHGADVSQESKLTDRDETTMSSTSLFPKDKDSNVTGGDSSVMGGDSSLSMMGTLIPAGQVHSGKSMSAMTDRDTMDLFTPGSKSSMSHLNVTSKNVSRLSELSLPIEDSQDLLRYSPPSGSQAESTPRIGSQSFHFSLPDDTQSQLLDDDGLLRVKSTGKKPARRQLMLEAGASQESMDELLGLCSGQFGDTPPQKSMKSSKNLFGMQSQAPDASMDELLGLCSGRFSSSSDVIPSTQAVGKDSAFSSVSGTQGMSELLGLCSGQFTVKGTQPAQSGSQAGGTTQGQDDEPDSPVKTTSRKRKHRMIEDDDTNSNDSFEVVSGNEAVEEDEEEVDELASDADTEDIDPDDEEETQRLQLFAGFTEAKGKKRKKMLQEFVEQEAELSGSECESDEDYDIDEKDDLLEHELGDDDQIMSDEKLRDQVGRVHLKTLIDDDKHQLRLYQERFLPDGDLHSEGNGRVRRFRWRNNDDDDTQQDMFNLSDDEEKATETAQDQEIEWRKQRLEREKFLEEQAKEAAADNDNSQLLKLGKTIFKPKPVISVTPEAAPSSQMRRVVTKTVSASASAPRTCNVFKKPHHGSFLTRSKDSLAKIAELTKPVNTTIGGAKNSGKFLFTALTPEQQKDQEKKPQVKRSMSVQSPAAKKPRLDRSSSIPHGSIFHHL